MNRAPGTPGTPGDPRHPVFHLAVAAEWERALDAGEYRRSTVDTSLEDEGFIHAAFAHQAQGVADRYYRGRDDIVLLTIDPDRLRESDVELRVEDTSGRGEGFPHLYGPLPVDAVVAVTPVPITADGRLDLTGLLDR